MEAAGRIGVLIPGTQVGDFVVEAALGSGAVAVVYRVRHERTGRRYALKVLRLLRADVERRFLREARIQASLVHPGIVPVRDMLEVGRAPGLLQELVEGPTLDRWIAEKQPTTSESLAVFRGILMAVSHAHRMGVVHRDLKPQNILMHWSHGEWRPRITDFGIAKLLNPDDPSMPQTAVGAVLGTPGFMAPEQYSSAADADERSDIFALGTVLYQLVTGMPAFHQSGMDARHQAAMAEDYLPAVDLVPDLPDKVSEAIAGCLRPAPSDRWPDCAALAAALPRGPKPVPISELPTELDRVPVVELVQASHVPVALDAFVGREAELQGLGAWAESQCRAMTILGPGGMGKTRLALHFAENARWRFSGGVWFVDLSTARDQAGMLRMVAQVLGIPLEPSRASAQLGRVMRALDRTLVVLDNLEQIADVACEVVTDWLKSAPKLRVLLTSRRRLQIPGEQVLQLGALVGAEGGPHPGVELFEARARCVTPDMTLDEEERAAVVRIVEELEGIPLAIELVAARAAIMMPSEMAERLARSGLERVELNVSRAGMLGAMNKAGNKRHRTMRACLDWSWSLLSPAERSTLSQLAVFDGGFTLEAAEAVVQVDDGSGPVFDLLQCLTHHSLVTLRSPSGPGGLARFHMLDLIRAYALEHVEHRQDVERRHGHFFARYGSLAFHNQVCSDSSMACYRALLLEIDNLARATAVAVDAGQDETAARLLSAGDLLVERGFHWPGWAEMVETVHARSPDGAAEGCKLARMLGWDVLRQGDWQRAVDLFAEGIGRAERCEQPAQALLNRIGMSYALRSGGDQARAFAAVQPVPAAAEHLDLPWVEARARMAIVGLIPGDVSLVQGREHLRIAIQISADSGDARGEVAATVNLAAALGNCGEEDEAGVLMEAALTRVQVLGRGSLVAEVMSMAGVRHMYQGELDLAEEWLRRASKMIVSLGYLHRQMLVHSRLMRVLAMQGAHQEAAQMRDELLQQLGSGEIADQISFYMWKNLAHAALRMGEQTSLEEALQQAEQILARHPDSPSLMAGSDLETLRQAVAQGSVSGPTKP
jgi:non-specific serine/threonine protein kinase